MILTPLQKLTVKVGDLGKNIVAKCFEWLPKVQKFTQSGHTEQKSVWKSAGKLSKNVSNPPGLFLFIFVKKLNTFFLYRIVISHSNMKLHNLITPNNFTFI